MQPIIDKWWKVGDYSTIKDMEDRASAIVNERNQKVQSIFNYCLEVYPDRFFDILYQNNNIFTSDVSSSSSVETNINTFFLPDIDFKYLWNCDVSDKTRETIWKYLQLILISIVGTINENKMGDTFSDTSKLFEMLNNNEFKNKLEETLGSMNHIFNNKESQGEQQREQQREEQGEEQSNHQMPNFEFDSENPLEGLMDAKLGKLAKEIAEETVIDMNMDDATDVNGVLKNLLKNPTKLMGLVKNVGSKLDDKIKSGEIKESELFAEATDIMNKMKNMPGMENLQGMFSKMGMNMPSNTKMDFNAMESQSKRNMKKSEMKDRMLNTLNKKKSDIDILNQKIQQQMQPSLSDQELISLFEKDNGEKKEKKKDAGKKAKAKK
jgi:hypothetical protein